MTAAREADQIPLYTIAVDRAEFDKLTASERDGFVYQARRLEELGYFVRQGRPPLEWAFIDFTEYSDFDHYLAECRKIHTGNAVRDAKKSERKGYYSKFFNPRVFVGDIVAVNTSTPERQGGPMSEHYFKSVEERGGYAASLEPEEAPKSDYYWIRHWGIFCANPGHHQGDLAVDEQLLGYCIVRRCAELMMYSTFLGHWDFLRDGITYKMHLDFVRTVLSQGAPHTGIAFDPSLRGARYLFYARYFTASSGLMMWKKRMLFRPGHFEFDYPTPPEPPLPPVPLAVLSLTATRAEVDFEASRFRHIAAADRPAFAMLDGATEPDEAASLNLFHALSRPQIWAPVNSVLIGSSLAARRHRLLIEALCECCWSVAPDVAIYVGTCEVIAEPASAGGRNLGQWMLGLAQRAADTSRAMDVNTIVPVLAAAANRAFGLDLLLRGLDRDIADVTAVGGGIGLVIYFALSDCGKGRRLNVTLIDHIAELRAVIFELYRANPEHTGAAVALTQLQNISEAQFSPGSQDMILFDAAVWRIPESERAPLFRRAWRALRGGGLLVVNAVVRSDNPASSDVRDRNFSHAPTRSNMIELMTFDGPPKLYRAASSWQNAEEADAISAADYGLDSFLVATGPEHTHSERNLAPPRIAGRLSSC
jgi:SAM-dependent methyltransferase